jgi:SAM-dependent methyltransferase
MKVVEDALVSARRIAAGARRRLAGPPRPWYEVAEPPVLRTWSSESSRRCNICDWVGAAFEGPEHCEGSRCPSCGSIGRDRFLVHCLFASVAWQPGLRLLETSPRLGDDYRAAMARWFDYQTSDFDQRAHRATITIDLQDIDLPDACFDIVCTAHVLEHVPDTDLALSELRRILRPGGTMILQVPLLQPKTAPPSAPEFHGDDTPVFWRFGHDLTERLRQHGFCAQLLCTDEFRNLARAGATRWYAASSPEFDADGVLAAAVPDDLVGVADDVLASTFGYRPAYMYMTWVAQAPATSMAD